MAFTTPSTNHQWIHDVFINFRGEDTRYTIVSHLYNALTNAGINTFLDDENLQKGTELKPELLRAIEGSKIAIIVFSKNYTESSWCLDELVQIVQCYQSYGQLILPIFYYVDPTVVRQQKGYFGKSLQLTAKKKFLDLPEYEVWRSVLTQVANISGWDIKNCRNEGELVKQIVAHVFTKLESSFLSITEFPVGLEPRMQKVVEFIEKQSSDVCMIGIWGMGGSGKTTTAKAIYNRIHRKFAHTSFVENIREACENDYYRGVIHLQKKILSDVLKTKEKIDSHSIALGTNKMETKLRGKRVFIVLDDVTSSQQLKALCGNRAWFGTGSVLIVTTRDAHLLNLLEVDYMCETQEMDKNDSLELFSWHTFREACPTKGFTELSKEVVTYCGGLPLALEVLGSYLYRRTKPEWKSVISKLKRIPNDQVHQKLSISYNGLEDDLKKDIFLDICFFFIGKDRAYVTEILNGCGFYADIGISVLIERSLLKVEKNNKLQMHDLIRDMGREIVRQSSPKDLGKRSRLLFDEDVCHVLAKNTGTDTVEGLALNLQRTSRVNFSTNAFKEMYKLRLLQLDCVDLIGDFGDISNQLRWINWQRLSFKCIPDDFYQENLVVFELKYSNVRQVWKETRLMEKLKILNLSHSKYLKIIPDFSKLPNLEKLILKDCPSLSEVNSSIGDLKNVLLINLMDCTSLGNLPREIYQLKSVKTLILSGCSKIDKLEEDIVQMESLTTLIAVNTGVKQVPFSIIRSKSIGYISLCGYEGTPHDVYPCIIRSWMSPTMNSLPRFPPFGSMPLSLVSLDVENNNLGLDYLLPKLSSLSELRSVQVQCHSKIQVTRELRRFLDDLYDANFTELETLPATQISVHSLRSILIGMGSYHKVVNTIGKIISQELRTNDSMDSFLPGDNYPSWLGYTCAGPSVYFQVPEDSDCEMKGIAFCVLYSSTLENMATECLTSVLIINYTKFTIQIYKRDTVTSFNDEDWQGVKSTLGVGDNVEIFVAFGHGLIVKETAVYLIYGQSTAIEIEPSITKEVEPSPEIKMKSKSLLEVNVQPLPNVKMEPLPDVKTEPSPEMEVHPSPDVKIEPSLDVKNESSPKSNSKIFIRLGKRVGECLCLNQN